MNYKKLYFISGDNVIKTQTVTENITPKQVMDKIDAIYKTNACFVTWKLSKETFSIL